MWIPRTVRGLNGALRNNPLSYRAAACLLNPYHPKEDADPPPLYDGAPGYLKWGNQYSPFNSQFDLYDRKTGAYFPTCVESRVFKIKGDEAGYSAKDPRWVRVELWANQQINYWGVGRFMPYANITTEGYWGSRFPMAPQVQPPWDTSKLYIPHSEIQVMIFQYEDEGRQEKLWTHITQKLNAQTGIMTHEQEDVWKPMEYEPAQDGYTSWYFYSTERWYKESGVDIKASDLDPFGYYQAGYSMEVVARDAEHDTQPPYDLTMLEGLIPDYDGPDTFVPLLAFHPQEDEFVWRWFKQDVRLTVYLFPMGCDKCWLDGKTYSTFIEYENGHCSNVPETALPDQDGNGCKKEIIFDGDKARETVANTISDQILYVPVDNSGPGEKAYVLGTVQWDNLGAGKAKRVIDFGVESIT